MTKKTITQPRTIRPQLSSIQREREHGQSKRKIKMINPIIISRLNPNPENANVQGGAHGGSLCVYVCMYVGVPVV